MEFQFTVLFLAVVFCCVKSGVIQSSIEATSDRREYTLNSTRLKRQTGQHFRYTDKAFPGIEDPPIERLVNKRVAPQWHIASRDGALKLGADSQIKGDHITTPLRELVKLRDGREILILSGGHGNEEGNNWVEVTNVRRPSERRTIRAPWHFDPDFWVDDVQQFMGRIGDEFQPIRSRLRIVDIAEMPLPTFRAMVLGDSHVILGFCFGWNDRAFRYYLGLRPVTSLVNPTRL